MGSLVGHLYPRLVRFALRVKEQEKNKNAMSYARAADVDDRSTVADLGFRGSEPLQVP